MSSHLLIFGFGYTAHYLVTKLRAMDDEVTATTRNQEALGYNASVDCEIIHFSEASVERALAKASHILISTPPNQDGGDPVLVNFGHLLKKHLNHIQWIGYLSSTSVYGDHQGNWVDELSQPISLGEQGTRRHSAENQWMSFAQGFQLSLNLFRLAGIYGPERNVLARLLAGKKETIIKKGHFFSRIHVEDFASVITSAMLNSKRGVSIYNVADDEPAPSHVVDEYAATLLQLPALREIPYEKATLSSMAKEFYSHNKRVSNAKLKKELDIQLTYPTYKEGLAHLYETEGDKGG